MTLGISIRNQVVKLINDPNIRSSLTLVPTTRYIGERGGYDVGDEVPSVTRTIYAIPSNYVKASIRMERIGDIIEGELRFLVNYNETISSTDKIIFDEDTFNIKQIKKIFFNEVVIAQLIVLVKEQ